MKFLTFLLLMYLTSILVPFFFFYLQNNPRSNIVKCIWELDLSHGWRWLIFLLLSDCVIAFELEYFITTSFASHIHLMLQTLDSKSIETFAPFFWFADLLILLVGCHAKLEVLCSVCYLISSLLVVARFQWRLNSLTTRNLWSKNKILMNKK